MRAAETRINRLFRYIKEVPSISHDAYYMYIHRYILYVNAVEIIDTHAGRRMKDVFAEEATRATFISLRGDMCTYCVWIDY